MFKDKRILWVLVGFGLLAAFILWQGSAEERINEATEHTKLSVPFTKDGYLVFLTPSGDTIQKIDLEIADNDQKRSQGLMYRSSIKENQGMLFIMEAEAPQSFWMKNTYISLDILFANSNKEIVRIRKNTRPYSEDQVLSDIPSLYVIEVAGGYTDAYGIEEGQKFDFQRQ